MDGVAQVILRRPFAQPKGPTLLKALVITRLSFAKLRNPL